MSQLQTSEKQNYYPINIDVANSSVLFVGGGKPVLSESQRILECGSRVDILAQRPIIEVKQLAVTYGHRVRILKETTYEGLVNGAIDLVDYALVFAYSSNHSVNEKLEALCKSKGVLCTTLSCHGDFVVPSLFRRGHLKVSISTDGISKSLEDVLLSKFEADSIDELDNYVLYLESVKEKLDSLPLPHSSRKKNKLIELTMALSSREDIASALRRNNFAEARKLFESSFKLMIEEFNLYEDKESLELAEN